MDKPDTIKVCKECLGLDFNAGMRLVRLTRLTQLLLTKH